MSAKSVPGKSHTPGWSPEEREDRIGQNGVSPDKPLSWIRKGRLLHEIHTTRFLDELLGPRRSPAVRPKNSSTAQVVEGSIDVCEDVRLLIQESPEFVLIVVGLATVIVLDLLFRDRCASCGRKWALKRTGLAQRGRWFTLAKKEWACKYCGHHQWKRDRTGEDGGV